MPRSRPLPLIGRRPMVVAILVLLSVSSALLGRREYYRVLARRHRDLIQVAKAIPIERWPGRSPLSRRRARLAWIQHQKLVASRYDHISMIPWLRDATDPVAVPGPGGFD